MLIRLVVNAVAFYLIARYLPGVHASSFVAALVAAIIFGVANAIVRPILILVTLPLTILTLGLFILVINAGMFWLVGHVTPGFHVDGFVPALEGAIIMMLVSLFTNQMGKTPATTIKINSPSR